jgi:hypothetical protein
MNESGIKDLIDNLSNKKVLDLVKIMKPLDVVRILVKKVDLHPKEASRIAVDLLKKIHGSSLKELDFIDYTPKFIDKTKTPTPMGAPRPTGWPYDDMTKSIMDPHTKGKKMPLLQGVEKMKKNNPGGYSPGLQQKVEPHSMDGSQSSSSSSWSKDGVKGWSKAMGSYEIPDNEAQPLVSTPPQFVPNTKQKRMGFRKK